MKRIISQSRLVLIALVLASFGFLTSVETVKADDSTVFQQDISGIWRGLENRNEFILLDLSDKDYKALVLYSDSITFKLSVNEFQPSVQSLIVDVVEIKVDGAIKSSELIPSFFKFRKIIRKKGFLLGITFLNSIPVTENVFTWVGDM